MWVFQFTICFLFAPSEFFVLLSILSSFFWVNRIVFRILFYLLVSGYASFFFFNKFIYLFIYLLAALGLRCCTRVFSSCCEQGLLFLAVRGLLIAVALVAEHGLFKCAGLSSCGAQAQ